MGFESPANDCLEKRIDWNEHISEHPLSTFFFRCNTDAMGGVYIPKGAILAVDRSVTPHNGHIVLAVVDGEFCVRTLQKNDYKAKLLAADRRVPDIVMNGDTSIWGVVVSVIVH